jgi:tRNA(Ile)-lysidine synthase
MVQKSGHREKNSNIAYIDVSDLDEDLVLGIRTRRPGDYIVPSGMKGRKKLQDFFVDIKIPRESRNEIPLLSAGNEIIWVAGIRMNEKFMVNELTKHMLSVEYVSKM